MLSIPREGYLDFWALPIIARMPPIIPPETIDSRPSQGPAVKQNGPIITVIPFTQWSVNPAGIWKRMSSIRQPRRG